MQILVLFLCCCCPVWWTTSVKLLAAPLGRPTSEAFSPKTVLEKTVCRHVQEKLHHSRATLSFLIILILSGCLYLYLCSKDVYSGSFPEHLSERWVLWMFPFTPLLKMCNLDLSLHIYLEDVYSRCFPAHLCKRCVVWVFHCISILKISILATLLHICLKDMHPDNVRTHLSET